MASLPEDYEGVRSLRIHIAMPWDEKRLKPLFDSLKLCLSTEKTPSFLTPNCIWHGSMYLALSYY